MSSTGDAVAESLNPIAQLCDGVPTFREEGGRRLVHMPGLHFLVGGQQRNMDALLCLNHNNPTYPTKLYLAEQVGAGLNWNENAFLLGRQWFTFSWRDVSSDQAIFDILAAHLAPLARGLAA